MGLMPLIGIFRLIGVQYGEIYKYIKIQKKFKLKKSFSFLMYIKVLMTEIHTVEAVNGAGQKVLHHTDHEVLLQDAQKAQHL